MIIGFAKLGRPNLCNSPTSGPISFEIEIVNIVWVSNEALLKPS